MSPLLLQSHHQPSSTFPELRSRHITIILILIGMCHLVRETSVPHKSAMMTSRIQRIGKQPIVRLVLRTHVRPHFTIQRRWCTMQNQHTSHRIRTIHQRGRTFQYLHRANTLFIHFHTMFITPLLTFLSHSLVHHNDAVITQPTDDGLRDASTCSDLRHTRLLRHSINHIRGSRLTEFLACHHRDGSRRVLQLRITRHTSHHHFFQLQVLIKHIRAILHLLSTVLHTVVLCRHYHGIAQQ